MSDMFDKVTSQQDIVKKLLVKSRDSADISNVRTDDHQIRSCAIPLQIVLKTSGKEFQDYNGI